MTYLRAIAFAALHPLGRVIVWGVPAACPSGLTVQSHRRGLYWWRCHLYYINGRLRRGCGVTTVPGTRIVSTICLWAGSAISFRACVSQTGSVRGALLTAPQTSATWVVRASPRIIDKDNMFLVDDEGAFGIVQYWTSRCMVEVCEA